MATFRSKTTGVEHDPGSQRLSITHAGNTYEGSVDDSGHFTTKPRTLSGGGSQYTISITCYFTSSGFEATVTVDVKQLTSPPTYSY